MRKEQEETVGFVGTAPLLDFTAEIDKQGLAGVTTKRLVDSTTMGFSLA